MDQSQFLHRMPLSADGVMPPNQASPTYQTRSSGGKEWPKSHFEAQSSTGPSNDAFILFDHILQHQQFEEYFDSIRCHIDMEDSLWNTIYALRTHPSATEAFRSLHRSLYREPSERIWVLLVELRNHKDWTTVQASMVCRMDELYDEMRASCSSSRLANIRTPSSLSNYSKHNSTGSGFAVHRSDLEETEKTADGSTGVSSKVSSPAFSPLRNQVSGPRKTPKGWVFFCPSRNCQMQFTTVGNYQNHIDKLHPNLPEHDPYDYLRQVSQAERKSNSTRRNVISNIDHMNQVMNEVPQAPSVSATGMLLRSDNQGHLVDYGVPTNVQYPQYSNQYLVQPLNIPANSGWSGYANTGVEFIMDNQIQFNQRHHPNRMPDSHETSVFDDTSDPEDGEK